MKTYKVISIVVAFIAIFVTGCATQNGGTVRYSTSTQNQPATKPLSIYGSQPKLAQVSRSGLTTKMLSQAFDTNEVWNEYKSSARRVVLPDNTLVLVSSQGYVWKADCGNRLLPVEPEQVVVHRPAPVQTVVVKDEPQVQYVHRQAPPRVVYVVDAPRQVRYVERRVCQPRPRCQNGGGLGGFLGGAIQTGFNLGIPAFQAANQALGYGGGQYRGSGHHYRGGGQVPFGSFPSGSSSFSGVSDNTRIINNTTSETRIRIRF